MAKRRSEEARVLAYFETASVESAILMLGLVKEAVKRRTAGSSVGQATTRAKVKKRKAGAPTPAATSFEPATLAQ